jgi:ethanolaminephosphotransferase
MMTGILWYFITLDWITLDTKPDQEGRCSLSQVLGMVLTFSSPNMIPKQREMDGIISQIYGAMETQDHFQSTLLVLVGDHGMNDAGNHGGSAPGETSPALVFISPKLKTISSGYGAPAPFRDDFQYYSTIEQSDIAPTLGGLLGFPVPRNNLGAFIPEFLSFWPKSIYFDPLSDIDTN